MKRLLAGMLMIGLAGALAAGAEAKSEMAGKSVDELCRLLSAELPYVRLEAAKALAAKGAEIVPKAIKLLGDKNPRIRRSAADVLEQIGPDAKAALGPLVKALGDKDAWVRDGAATALGTVGKDSPEAAKALAKAAADSDSFVRESAMSAITKTTKDKALLLQAALNCLKVHSSGWGAKRHAMGLLKQYGKGHKPAIPILLDLLKDSPEGMWDGRGQAVQMLADLGAADKAYPILFKMLDSKQRTLRRIGINGLGTLGGAALPAVPRLEDMAKNDSDKGNRNTAAKVVAKLKEAPKDKTK